MVDGFSTAPLRRDSMSFGGDDHGGDLTFGWDNSNLMGYDANEDLQNADLQRMFNPFVCDCHGWGFPKKADLNRHVAKETKRFLCDVDACPSTQPNGDAPVFGTLNDKKRHYRDVHGTDLRGNNLPKFICPWTNCKRHTDGFPRPKNLENHLKSLHDSQRPEPVAGDDAQIASQSAVLSAGTSSGAASFSAPNHASASQATSVPALTRDPTFETLNSTPLDSQRDEAHESTPVAPLRPLTAAEAADPVVLNYEENISSIRAETDSRSSHLATIKQELASMQATCNTLERELAENRATEHFLVTQLAKRKEAIRVGRTHNAQRRAAAAAAAIAAAVSGAATAPPTTQND